MDTMQGLIMDLIVQSQQTLPLFDGLIMEKQQNW